MATYTYTIFDANPQSSSGTEWPSHQDIEIEADDDGEAISDVRDVMEIEAAGLSPSDGYDVGDSIHAIVWDADGTIVGQPSHTLTNDDLGVTPDVRCECGQWSGVQCEWTGPECETETITYMPEHLRETHRAAGNSGSYPHNGSIRLAVHPDCAARIRESDAQEEATR